MHSLWDDPRVLEERSEKSAAALVAVARVLERERPLVGGEEEFLRLYVRVVALPADAFTAIWTGDPAAYRWARFAYELLGACVTNLPVASPLAAYLKALDCSQPRAGLKRHLADFKRFVLALHHRVGLDCRFDTPWETELPWAIAGTSLSLEGPGRARIAGLDHGRLEIQDVAGREHVTLAPAAGGERTPQGEATALPPQAGLRITQCPVVRRAGAEILLQPHAFHLPGFDDAAPALAAGLAFQERHQALVAEALGLIGRFHPETFAQFREFIRIIALKPLRAGGYTNLSHSDLPGAFIASLVRSPLELADTFIHEFHHNRLFALEDRGELFADEGDESLDDGRFYSPWRDDPRPLRGVLHGIYVYIPVCVYWQRLLASGELTGDAAAYALDRVLRITSQVTLALDELEAHARLTSRGTELVAALKSGVAAIHAANRAARLPADAPALVCEEDGSFRSELDKRTGRALSVREAVLTHARRDEATPEAS